MRPSLPWLGWRTRCASFVAGRPSGVSRRGELVFTWEMRPHFAQYQMLIQIDILLTVEISIWFDYDATVSYFIYPYLDSQYHLRARVANVKGWVEGGILSGSIASQLKSGATPKSVTGKLEKQLNDVLDSLNYRAWEGFYLMPGEAPLYRWEDYSGSTRDEVTLVLVPR